MRIRRGESYGQSRGSQREVSILEYSMETFREISPARVTETVWVRWELSAASSFESKGGKRSETAKTD